MAVGFDHTIAHARDKWVTARFVTEVLGLPEPKAFGPFAGIELANGVTLDFIDADDSTPDEVLHTHYCFLISEKEFDEVLARLSSLGVEHYADPAGQEPGRINTHDGGRGCYFSSPDGHWLEVITRRYGSGG